MNILFKKTILNKIKTKIYKNNYQVKNIKI